MSATSAPQTRRSAGDNKNITPPSNVVTRNAARKAKVQTRAMSSGTKALILAAKKKAQHKKKHKGDMILRDHFHIAMNSKLRMKGPTGFITDPYMSEHKCLFDENYPECPERLISIIKRCNELRLVEQCKKFEPRHATKEEIMTLHSPFLYEMLESTHNIKDLSQLEEISSVYDAIYFHPSTHEVALSAVGSTIDMVDRVVCGEVQNGVAFVRPPGHHAMRSEPCGYCFYNNVALAAKHAIDKRGLNRILIVDWDVHHGQATQQMFYNDPRVVYFSIHRYEYGTFWPNLRQSDYNYVGGGKGKGFNFNVPLNKTGMTDADYCAIWHQLLLPMALEYQPELIIVSAGYDAALGCPEGEMEVTPACFASLTHMLMAVCPSVCVVLEGGYCIESLADAAALTLRTLLHHAPPALTLGEVSDTIRDTILDCIYVHKPYWRCYKFQETYSINDYSIYSEQERHRPTVKWEGDETRPDKFTIVGAYPQRDRETEEKLYKRIMHLRMVTDLSTPQHAVGYTYDEAMLKHKNICEPGHVECPERVMRIHERHRDYGLLERLHQLSGRTATDEEILSVHTQQHLNRLKKVSITKVRDLMKNQEKFESLYLHPDSMQSASVALGCALKMVDAVLTNETGSGVCVIRPPGHHADEETPSGFCLLNNVAAAAKYAVESHGMNRVLILDWDVHHGNGTQRITYADNKILYMSIHRYDDGSFFPHSAEANYVSVGEGRGEGFNVNVPWNKRGMGDNEYMAAFTKIVLPIAYEFNPELVIVSAGFDACIGDPLGGCKVTPECYGRMTQFLRGLSRGRVILCLEGGYNVTSISYAMTMCTKALLGDPIIHHYDPKATCHWSAVESINNVIKVHKKYWSSLKFQLPLPKENILEEPPPSRGLTITADQNHVDDTEKLCESLSSLNDSDKSLNLTLKFITTLDNSVTSKLARLSLGEKQKCLDGVHCGTDDEVDNETPSSSKQSQGAMGGSDINATTSKQGVPRSSKEAANNTSKQTSTNQEAAEKQTLADYLAENMQAIIDEEMFAVIPMSWCPHLDSLSVIPVSVKFEQGVKCVDCEEKSENWVCLQCYVTACGRSVNGHMQAHYRLTQHPLVLSLLDLSVWCNVCEAYVDNELLYDAKNNAHRCKFGEEMPWCYRSNTLVMQ